MSEYISITREELLKETFYFKQWSGPSLVKIFRLEGNQLTTLGSGGLLKYKGRFFVITNWHVVRRVPKENQRQEIVIAYKDAQNIDYRATIINNDQDSGADLAALEIKPASVHFMRNHWFLDETYIEEDVASYANRSNIAFLHGYPWDQTEFDHQERIVTSTSLPYTTFIEKYETYSDIISLFVEEEAISEQGEYVTLPDFYGMSGSLVYGYYRGEMIPYKCLGILTNWHIRTKRLDVYPMHDVTKFLDDKFFN